MYFYKYQKKYIIKIDFCSYFNIITYINIVFFKNIMNKARNIIPTKLGWIKDSGTNITYVKKSVSTWITWLFWNDLMPHEQWMLLSEGINWKVFQDSFRQKVNDILCRDDCEYFYYKESINQNVFQFQNANKLVISELLDKWDMTNHHIVPRSAGWHLYNTKNLIMLERWQHEALHRIFHNMLPHEQLIYLMNEINYPALTNYFLNDLINVFKWIDDINDIYIKHSLKHSVRENIAA